MRHAVAIANLALLFAFPFAWFAPLMTLRLWRWGSEREVTVISGLQTLWAEDPALALLVSFLALFAPMAKVIGLALIHSGLLQTRVLGALFVLGRLAMADVFLVAVWVVGLRGLGIGSIRLEWGLWLFTFCVLAALALSLATERLWRR